MEHTETAEDMKIEGGKSNFIQPVIKGVMGSPKCEGFFIQDKIWEKRKYCI